MSALPKPISEPRSTSGITSATLPQMIAEYGEPNITDRGRHGRTAYTWALEDRILIYSPSKGEAAELTIEDRI